MYLIFAFDKGKQKGGINDLVGYAKSEEAANNFVEYREEDIVQVISVNQLDGKFETLEVI